MTADRPRPLEGLDPLAPAAAVLPAMIALVVSRGIALPAAMAASAVLLLAAGARLTARTWALVLLGGPVGVVALAVTLALWADPADAAAAPTWPRWAPEAIRAGLDVGAATALRLAALLLLGLVAGAGTTPRRLVLALIAHLGLPHRAGYAILVGIRFVPEVAADLRVLGRVRRLRGRGGRGPVAALRRRAGYPLPLAATGIRRATAVAMAMDAREFGAHPTRTERDLPKWTRRDSAAVVLSWAGTVACLALLG